jgi:hypothetical protein
MELRRQVVASPELPMMLKQEIEKGSLFFSKRTHEDKDSIQKDSFKIGC